MSADYLFQQDKLYDVRFDTGDKVIQVRNILARTRSASFFLAIQMFSAIFHIPARKFAHTTIKKLFGVWVGPPACYKNVKDALCIPFKPDLYNIQVSPFRFQCGRHNDIFKFWLQWRAKGDLGFERQIERLMDLTAYQVKRMKEQGEKFYLLNDEPECTNVIFW